MNQLMETAMDERPIKILLVEDDQDAARIIDGLITAEGKTFELEWFGHLAPALQRVAQGAVDLIMLDLALPDSQNLDALVRVQQQSPNLPVIVLTGINDESIALKAMQLGAQDYLFKGQFNRQLLIRSLRYAIERKRAEQALRKSEERFRALIENSWDGLLLLTPDGEMLYASPSTHRILGHVGDELISQNAFALMHPDDLPRISEQFRLLLTRPDETMTAEFRYQHKDGSWRWLECTATNLLVNQSVESLVINYREITERKTNEAELRRARDELEERVKERTAELEALSRRLVEVQEQERRSIARELHDEVGQILTGLKMNLELIKRLPTDALDEGIARLQQQVNELFARVRDLSLNLRPAMLDDLGLLPALLWLFDRYSAQTKVQVNFKHSSVESRYAPELETAIYRIVQEAMTNAARHSHAKEITVLLWTSLGTIGVQIEDQGVGFSQESIRMTGHSNGLTGMRERASLLGGRLTVESSPGSGTCVTAELPLIMVSSQTQERILI